MTGEKDLNDCWTLTFGAAHGERAPELTELYADEPFIGIPQKGIAYITGNPLLDKEIATQFDVGLRADYCTRRFGARGYFAWVEDYITYGASPNGNDLPALNAPLRNSDSWFFGLEFNGEIDLTNNVSVFATSAYTYGQDEELFNEPVYAIYPWDSVVGVRLEQGDACGGWGIEFSARLVDEQDRVANGFDNLGRSRGEQVTPGFTVFDLRTYWRLNQAVLLTAGIENIADRNYLEHYDYRAPFRVRKGPNPFTDSFQPGRNLYVGGEVNW